jgi:uncharacterized protein (DUF4415 family)
LPDGWEKTVITGLPPGKDAIKRRIDRDVLEWFRDRKRLPDAHEQRAAGFREIPAV